MEKHRCKLCLKSFVNGRALGGHMRSHMFNVPIPSKLEEPTNQPTQSEAASASYSSDDEDGEKSGQFYGLRENPKRSVRMVDPEFVDAGSVVLQDRESETESSKNPTRRRSKRTRKILDHHQQQQQQQQGDEEEETKKLKININRLSKTESWAEPEPVSSISDTTTEEDVAFCLMMLSRDQWKSKAHQNYEDEEEEDDDDDDDDEEEETDESEGYFKLIKVNNRTARAKYRCETCNKVFKSYQALGGHRASHKKIKATHETELKPENVGTCSMTEKKIHECPVCFRVFSSGQALGGHKRSHVTGQAVATAKTSIKTSKKSGDGLIDLNLPAPIDDDDASQIELSAVSDAEFVK